MMVDKSTGSNAATCTGSGGAACHPRPAAGHPRRQTSQDRPKTGPGHKTHVLGFPRCKAPRASTTRCWPPCRLRGRAAKARTPAAHSAFLVAAFRGICGTPGLAWCLVHSGPPRWGAPPPGRSAAPKPRAGGLAQVIRRPPARCTLRGPLLAPGAPPRPISGRRRRSRPTRDAALGRPPEQPAANANPCPGGGALGVQRSR